MGGDGLVLRRAVPQTERHLHAIGRDPQRDDAAAALQLDRVEHQHREPDVGQRAAHERVEMLASAPDELARDRRLRRRALRIEQLLADRLTRPGEAPRRDAGKHLLQHDPGQRITVGEVRIAGQRHLALAVDGPDARALDRDAPAAERDLAGLVAVAHRSAVRVALALRADDIVDLLFQQLGQHAEPGRDAQRQQPLLRCPDQFAQRLLHTRGQHGLLRGHGGRDRHGLLHGGSSFDLSGIAANAPHRNRRGRRDRRQVLRATGQPPSTRTACASHSRKAPV